MTHPEDNAPIPHPRHNPLAGSRDPERPGEQAGETSHHCCNDTKSVDESIDEVSAIMTELRQEYIHSFDDIIQECDRLIACHDIQGLGGLGHRLKGNGASYGFQDISTIGADMEESGRKGDLEHVIQCTEKLKQISQEFKAGTRNASA